MTATPNPSPSPFVDVLIVTAVKDERDVVQALEQDWQERLDESGFPYHVRQDPNGLRWALARAAEMGSEFAANVATRLVATLKPRCLAMVGVCAGWREKVHLGDVVVAERLFRYDHGKLRAFRAGAERKEEVFQDLRTYNLDARWRQRAEDFPSSWTSTIRGVSRPLGYRGQEAWTLLALDEHESGGGPPPRDHAERAQKCPDWTEVIARLEKRGLIALAGGLRLTDPGRSLVRELRDRYPDGYPGEPGEPKSHVAPMATGGRVVEDEELFPTIHRYARRTLAVEMEGSAIGAVAEIEGVGHCLVVKGVQDHADSDKDDRFRSYAIEASYRFLVAFLRRQMGPPRRGVPFIVPQHETTSFTGREDEMEALGKALLGERKARVCTIAGLSGTGGIGKSAMAVHFASLHRSHFTDGVLGIRVDGKDVDTIAREFARNAGDVIDPEDDRDASAIMQSLFSGRDCLLIFDNAEDPGVRQLIPGGRCAVIITTRDRGLAVLLEVPETARIDVPVLPVERALELLRKHLGGRIDAEPDAARRIVAAVGGLPLALQIVAASLEMEPWRLLTSLADALELERERLSRLAIRSDPHLDVRISFNGSLKLLSPEELDFFACLSVCDADSFAVHSAAAAAGCAEAAAVERLGYLYRLSLLNRPETMASDRFVLHPLLRAFARELAGERRLAEEAAERHARYFIERVKSTDTRDARRSAMLALDIGEALTAASWLLSQSALDYQFLRGLGPLLERHGYWREAADLVTPFLAAAEASGNSEAAIHLRIQQGKFLQLKGDFQGSLDILGPAFERLDGLADAGARIRSRLLNTYGGALQRLGRFQDAADVLQQARTIDEGTGDRRSLAMVLNSLGGVMQRLGRFQEATDALQQARTIDEEIGNQRSLAMVLNSLSGVMQRLGRFQEAADALQQARTINEEMGDQRSLAMVLNSLGGVMQRLGRFEEATDALQQARTINETMGDQRSLAMVLNSLGGVLQRLGKFEEATDALQQARTIIEEMGDQRSLAMVLNSLSGVMQRLGRFQEAAEALQQARTINETMGDRRSLAMVLNSLGGVLQRLGKFPEAADALQHARTINEEMGDQRSLAMVLNSLGGVLQRLGRFQEAAEALQHARTINEEMGDQRSLAMVLNSLGGVLQRLGRFQEAADILFQAGTVEERLGNRRGRAMVLNSLGGVLQQLGRLEEATTVLRQSYESLVEQGDRRGQAMVLNSLGGVLQQLGRLEEASTTFQQSYELLTDQGDSRGQAMVLNSLGSVLQRLDRFDEAATALRRSYELLDEQGDDRGQAMALNSLSGVLRRLGKLQEAADALKEAGQIEVRLGNQRGQAIVLNSLGGILQRLGRFQDAADALAQASDIEERIGNQHGRAIVLNSLGVVLLRLGRLEEAEKAFMSCIAINEKLKDYFGLAKALTSYGRALVSRGDFQGGLKQLRQGFDLDEQARNARGITIVTPVLVETLRRLGVEQEAEEVIKRALAIAPGAREIQRLTSSAHEVTPPLPAVWRTGRVKRILEPMGRARFGFLIPDGGGEDVYFSERCIGVELFSSLKAHARVEAEIITTPRGQEALRIRIL